MREWIGITLGDVTGIGPEVTAKALAAELAADDATSYLVIGDRGSLHGHAERAGLPLARFTGYTGDARVRVLETLPSGLPSSLEAGAPEAAEAALSWLREGVRRCLGGELRALVTAPVNKAAIIRAGHSFVGQTELLSGLAGTDRTVMMLLGADDRGRWVRVALATTHVSIRDLPDRISRGRVELAIELGAKACSDLGLARARIGVCGLNPHAGEEGMLGDEELRFIGPAVASLRKSGLDACGPLAADTLFHQAYRGEYDVVVAMYHDQGLAPLKMVAFENGVNWTLGLPFIRVSPDHGTAYDLAGLDRANPSSMRAAIRLARQLARHRTRH